MNDDFNFSKSYENNYICSSKNESYSENYFSNSTDNKNTIISKTDKKTNKIQNTNKSNKSNITNKKFNKYNIKRSKPIDIEPHFMDNFSTNLSSSLEDKLQLPNSQNNIFTSSLSFNSLNNSNEIYEKYENNQNKNKKNENRQNSKIKHSSKNKKNNFTVVSKPINIPRYMTQSDYTNHNRSSRSLKNYFNSSINFLKESYDYISSHNKSV